jgi:hypothetical protein
MKPVDCDSIDRMQIRQRLTFRPAECNVSAYLPHRAAGFDASNNVSSGQVLVLKTYARLRENPYRVDTAEHVSRQRKPSLVS